jgi:hypothetical protein
MTVQSSRNACDSVSLLIEPRVIKLGGNLARWCTKNAMWVAMRPVVTGHLDTQIILSLCSVYTYGILTLISSTANFYYLILQDTILYTVRDRMYENLVIGRV